MAGPLYEVDVHDLQVVPLDGLTLVFHGPSGQTHFVASPVPQILDGLSGGAADVETLLQRMSEQFEVQDRDVAATVLSQRLDELDALGLVRRR